MAHPTRPLIGINTDFLAASKHGPAHVRLHAGYFDAVVAAGGFPILVPPLGKDVDVDPLLDRLDGFVLCGGLDLDPKRQGQASHASVLAMAERREESDRLVARRLVARQMPLLAIGVGMQQLNAARGGSLFLHLPEDLPRAMPHRDPSGGPHRHIVVLEPNTRMEEIYGAGEIRVNSAHHQAVRQPGADLRVGAVSPDGVIEAIEATDPNWFCVGVQWHPESDTASALDMQLFECFVQACVRQAQPLQLAA
ncbi:MAG TPA: gamma-glutamyl-gamma-aminobutyrate hydrolase family protein [Gemmataceae bacterium]